MTVDRSEKANKKLNELKKSMSKKIRSYSYSYFTWIRANLLLALTLYFYSNISTPDDPLVKRVLEYMTTAGFFFIVAFPFMLGLLSETIKLVVSGSKRFSGYAFQFYRLLMALTTYTFLLWVVGLYGDTIFHWAINEPEEGVAGFIALFITFMVIVLVIQLLPSNNHFYLGTEESKYEGRGVAEYAKKG